MTGIALRFPSGQFHATPWGRHVNEGAPEWPPSPWRLLRALVATWKRKLLDAPDQAAIEATIRALAQPPEFVLPPAATAHTRHYMPKRGPRETDPPVMVFDAFVVLPKTAEVIALWPELNLPSEQTKALEMLLNHLSTLGRGESWASARILSNLEAESARAQVNSNPLDGDVTQDMEVVRVLCPHPEEAFANEHFFKVERTTKKGKTVEAQKRTAPNYEPDWHLCAETLWLHEQRWSDAPGSFWLSYTRPRDCFKVAPARPTRVRRVDDRQPQVARFALDSTVLPLVTHTLPVAEDARRNLMGIFGRCFQTADGQRANSAIFSGKDEEGTPGKKHGHAFYLPTDEDGDGRLDHLTIVTADGFGLQELQVLDKLREIKSHEREQSGHPLGVLLLSLDRLERCRVGPVAEAQEWHSVTPFLTPRFAKARGTKRDPREMLHSPHAFLLVTLREEIARLITRRPDLANIDPQSVEIEPLLDERSEHFRLPQTLGAGLRPIQFKRFRQKNGDDGGRRPAGAFKLKFPRAIQGPIAFGHSSHFGLGMFIPMEDWSRT